MKNKSKAVILSFIVILLLTGLIFGSAEIIRQPAVAGTFYPADPSELNFMVTEHLKNVKDLPEIDGQIIALIVPHAGLIYSGQIAAYAFKTIENSDINRVILCGPSHHYPFEGVSVYGPDVAWETPLGKISCDNDLCNRLIESDPEIQMLQEAQEKEHCLEVELPYLKNVLGEFKIVPAVMGYQSPETVNMLADKLAELPFNDKTLLVASSDWQHYRPASVGWPMDSLGLECIRNLNPDRLYKLLKAGQVEACGGGPIVSVMKAALKLGANKVKILKYGDSGDVTGDKSSVVSYVAAVLYKSNDSESSATENEKITPESEVPTKKPYRLSLSEKEKLLEIARSSIKNYLETGETPEYEVSEKLKAPGAAFVTLEKNSRLRGCIGYTQAIEPLYKTVSDCAIKAAVADPRFPPVTRSELDKLHIEISVLTPLREVASLDEIEVGRDGLMIRKGYNSGLLLPQVATDYGWNRKQFLEQTCRKAGLPTDAYKSPDAVLYKFQALIFDE